jgi:hypothetical protein
MFANCQLGGMHFAFPDTCNTPIGPALVPIPYPNTSMGMTANPATACKKIFLSCMPAHNLMTQGTISQGDNAGVGLGVASGMVMGPCKHLMGSVGVIYEGAPVTKMTSPTGQNGISLNAPGLTLVPSQFKVMIMR